MPHTGFLDGIRRHDGFGLSTTEHVVQGIPYLSGQFWTERQRQGHSIHEVSYRGCFKAELPDFFIQGLTEPGDTVYDPFAGRGTTLIQAALSGRKPCGNDINPLSPMLCRPRLAPPSLAAIQRRLDLLDLPGMPGPTLPIDLPDDDLLAFYHPQTLHQLRALRSYLNDSEQAGDFDTVDDWIRMVAIGRLTGHSPGYFSVYTLPPNQAASAASQRKINHKRQQTPPVRDVAALILRKSRALLRGAPVAGVDGLFSVAPAWDAPTIADGSVDLVVTSPPFLDVIDYAADNWLRLWFAMIDPSSVAISILSCVQEWQAMVRRVLADLARVVKPGGTVAFEVGEVTHKKDIVHLETLVWAAAADLPFERLAVIVNGGSFTKTANIWRVENNAKGTNTNRIVLLRRSPA